MNSFALTAQSAIHTFSAVLRKGKRDLTVIWQFLKDEEMIALYRAIWQSFVGLSYLCYGLGVISRRAMDRLIEESLEETHVESLGDTNESTEITDSTNESTNEPPEDNNESAESEATKLEAIVSDWNTELKPMLIDSFVQLPKDKQVQVLRELGLVWRSRNRRFNKEELLTIYRTHLDSL